MALKDLWEHSREQIEDKQVYQIIAFAGDGSLRDGSKASRDFRKFLSLIPPVYLRLYAEQCLNSPFSGSGLALQDIVNQVGNRLGFEVTDGRYRGAAGHIGFDGLWQMPDGHTIVVEVKTTDAYRIDLETVSGYRNALIREGLIQENLSSILIVVGRSDAGDLEAQIRGSRHARDIRLISVDSLLDLMRLKQEVENPHIIKRMHDILIPREFTKLDEIVEILFSTAEDIKEVEPEDEVVQEDVKKPKFKPVSFNEACVERVEKRLQRTLVKRTRTSYSTAEGETALVCAVSKEHQTSGGSRYWFAFHPHQ